MSLCSVDTAGVAAASSIMGMDISCILIAEETFNRAFDFCALHNLCTDNHALFIIGTQRQQSGAHNGRHFVETVIDLCGMLMHINCMCCIIRRFHRLADMVEQQQAVTNCNLTHTDTVRIIYIIGNHANCTMLCQFIIGQAE